MLLTIDIGTSTFKSAVWDYHGHCISIFCVPVCAEYDDVTKHEINPYLINPSVWIKSFEECCKKHNDLKKIEVIIISGNGPTLVPVMQEECENARLWQDRRAEKYANEVSALMGGYVDAKFFLPKILYIKNEEEKVYEKTDFFLGCPEYLAFKLTRQAKTVIPCDGFDRWFWNDDVLEKLSLDKEKFPSFIRPGGVFGTIIPSAAQHYGFKNDIPVISGGPDFFAAILGSGVKEPGQICNRTGTSDGINLCTKNHVNKDKLMSYRHPVKPFWNLSGIIESTGKKIEEGFKKSGFNEFEKYLNSETARQIFKEICYSVKDVINTMENAGEETLHIHVTGGLSNCEPLNQMKADITGIEVLEGVHKEAELLGLVMIGSCFKGEFASLKEASEALYTVKKRYLPRIH